MECDKRTYKTEQAAYDDLMSLRGRNKNHKFSIYKCVHCGMFHITTITKKVMKPKRKEKYPLKVDYNIERTDRNKPKK